MKRLSIKILATAIISLSLWACSGQKSPSALVEQSQRINAELTALADDSPMFVDSMTCSYNNSTLTVNIALADTDIDNFSDALIRYFVAIYARNNKGTNLDTTVNTLVAEDGKLIVNLTNAAGQQKVCEIPARTLRTLVTAKLMELSFNDVRTNVSDIFDSKCAAYATAVNATGCTFHIQGNFAQYTLTFKAPTAYANLNQGSLTGRYLKVVEPIFDNYGACRPYIEEVLASLNIEGYRFIYTSEGGKELRAAITWNMIKNTVEQ